MQYFIIGAMPPPRGGVAVYLERKVALLRQEGHVVEWLNPRKLFKFVFLLLKVRSLGFNDSIIELHTAHPVAFFLICILGLEKKITFYDHNYSDGFKGKRGFSKLLLIRFSRRVSTVVVVSNHLIRNYDFLGCKSNFNFVVETPYIGLSNLPEMSGRVVEKAAALIESCDVTFINAAWNLVDDKNGKDLYGVKWSVDSFLNLFSSKLNAGLILIVGGGTEAKLSELKEACKNYPNILLLEGNHDLCAYLRQGNVVLMRTTTTDGDSLSVREAIELGAAVVASDAAPRPNGTNVYKLHSRSSFESALMDEYRKITENAR